MSSISKYNKLLAFIACVTLIISSCKKDSNDPSGSGGSASGRFSGHMSCSVIAPPAEVNLNTYYTKYINCGGIPVIGSDSISDEALTMGDATIAFMLKGLDDVKSKLIENGSYYALSFTSGNALNNLPEISVVTETTGGQYNNGMAVSAESNLLCLPGNKAIGTNTMVHELAHMMHDVALRRLHSGFQSELDAAYSNAKSIGLWTNTYSISASQEYLAVGVTIWYSVLTPGPKGGDGHVNDIYTREQLQQYDPTLYQFIAKYFNAERDVPGCVKPTTVTNTNCEPTVTDVDGNVYNVVSIGSQCWLKENLKTSRFNDGSPITKWTDVPDWSNKWFNNTQPGFIYYDNDESNNDKYGKLYNGYAVETKKLCPNGWHIPTREDWDLLIKQTDSKNDSKALRSSTEWTIGVGTNSSGLTILPAGHISGYDFAEMGRRSVFWTSSPYAKPWEYQNTTISITGNEPIFIAGSNKHAGFSCRCVKD